MKSKLFSVMLKSPEAIHFAADEYEIVDGLMWFRTVKRCDSGRISDAVGCVSVDQIVFMIIVENTEGMQTSGGEATEGS